MAGRGDRNAIVACVSGSPDCDRAVDWSGRWAARTGRPLTLLHAAAGVDGDLGVGVDAARRLLDITAERVAHEHPGLQLSLVVEVGDPRAVIVDQARRASVVVVGSHRGDARRRLHGSLGPVVARDAICPVVVVGESPPQGPLARRVVVGVDGTAASRPATEFAFEYGATTNLPVVLLHCSWERLARGSAVLALLSRGEEHGPTRDEELSVAEVIAGLPGRYPDVETRIRHRSSDPAAALVEASQTAHLVVVGVRRHHPVVVRLHRPVSSVVADRAHCPVALVNAS
ncbi:universal stress protein [Pimelobacter simplex]|uniref:universal stress protein n=1 Tax=Nocardioides simplex TaxID=2045 RepID=UPI003AAB3051